MDVQALMAEYARGPQLLREAVAGMSREELVARPVPGKWSTLEVVCHIADVEPIYADRIKRTIVEDEPTLFGMDPDRFLARLPCHQRDVEAELDLVAAVRRHLTGILRHLDPSALQRTGRHSVDGPLTAATFLQRITNHLPHHLRFIQEKREALRRAGGA